MMLRFLLSNFSTLTCLFGFVTIVKFSDSFCGMDIFTRITCPSNSSEQYQDQFNCTNNSCCWDTSWTSVPYCFYPGNESALTSPEIDNAIDAVNELMSHPSNAQPGELSEIVNGVLDANGLTRGGSILMRKVLSAADNIYIAHSDHSETTDVSSWTRFFDNLLQYPDLKTSENAQDFLNVSNTILIKSITSSATYDPSSHQIAPFEVIRKLEEYLSALTSTLLRNMALSSHSVSREFQFKNVILKSCREGAEESDFCDIFNDDVTASVTTPGVRAYVSSATYKPTLDLKVLQNGKFQGYRATMGSALCSVTSHNADNDVSNVNVVMTFKKRDYTGSASAVCAFISDSTGDWSDTGCTVTSETSEVVTCSCSHNTSFALLFLHSDIGISELDENYFQVITFVGCGISITALLLTIFSFLYLKLTRIKRVILHLNLAVTLCIGQIVLLIGNNIDVGTPQCKVIAILLHFFFMASFSWMLMEGILLYFNSVRATKGDVNFNLMLVFGWALPVVVVGISLAAGYDGYGSDRGCWLSINNGLTWAFIGPALGFILINLILLGMILKVFLNLKSNTTSSEWQRTKRAIRAAALLTPLLGITWCFGALAVNQETKWFLYLFTICNSFQGLAIFIFHCLQNHDVRKALLKKYRRSFHHLPSFFANSSIAPNSSGMTYVNSVSASSSTPSFTRKM